VVNIQDAEGMMLLAPIDDCEIEKKFDEIGNELKEQDGRIRELEIESAKTGQKLDYLKLSQDEIKESINRIETSTLNNQNSILTSLNALIINRENNETKKEINKQNNKNSLYLKILGVISLIGGSFFAGKNL